MSVVSIAFCAAADQLSCDQTEIRKLFSQFWYREWVGPPSDFIAGNITKLSMPFQVLRVVVTLQRNIFLRLRS